MKRYKDESIRTTAISKPFRNVVIALSMIIISVIWIPIGMFQYAGVVARSSSAIGSQFKFERSNSEVTLKNLYTDKKNDVLIARIGLSDDAQLNLPYKGSDFKVLIGSKSLKGRKEASVLFGKMSTDGDMFLMIPKPSKDDVYTIFLVNTKYVAAVDSQNLSQAQSSSQLDNAIDQSITSTLSAYDLDSKNDKNKVTSVKSDDLDAITFRLALKPGINNDKYRPEVLDVDLVKHNEFQFKTFFNEVFKKTAVESMEKDYKRLVANKKQVQASLNEAKEKLKINEFDKQAIQARNKAESQIEDLDSKISQVTSTLQKYEDLEYSDDLFANLNTKAKVFDVDEFKKQRK